MMRSLSDEICLITRPVGSRSREREELPVRSRKDRGEERPHSESSAQPETKTSNETDNRINLHSPSATHRGTQRERLPTTRDKRTEGGSCVQTMIYHLFLSSCLHSPMNLAVHHYVRKRMQDNQTTVLAQSCFPSFPSPLAPSFLSLTHWLTYLVKIRVSSNLERGMKHDQLVQQATQTPHIRLEVVGTTLKGKNED